MVAGQAMHLPQAQPNPATEKYVQNNNGNYGTASPINGQQRHVHSRGAVQEISHGQISTQQRVGSSQHGRASLSLSHR
jgi:hypothetical protein